MDHEAVLKKLAERVQSRGDVLADAAADLIRDLRTEIDNLETAKVSIDVSTGDDDAGHRVFGCVVDRQSDDDGSIRLLCEYESDNFGMRTAADNVALIAAVPQLVEALRRIAGRIPKRENSVYGQRWRCPACQYASQSSDEPPRHAAHCDAEIARAAIASIGRGK